MGCGDVRQQVQLNTAIGSERGVCAHGFLCLVPVQGEVRLERESRDFLKDECLLFASLLWLG